MVQDVVSQVDMEPWPEELLLSTAGPSGPEGGGLSPPLHEWRHSMAHATQCSRPFPVESIKGTGVAFNGGAKATRKGIRQWLRAYLDFLILALQVFGSKRDDWDPILVFPMPECRGIRLHIWASP